MLQVDDCRNVPHADLRMAFLEKGIEVFFGWLLLVNPGDRLVDALAETCLLQIFVDGNENLADIFCRCLLVGNQSGIGKTLVRIERVSVLIGREQGIELVVAENHERVVMESVAVIIHVRTVEKEGGLLGLRHKLVPSFTVGGGSVSLDRYHDCPFLVYSRKSSYS